MRDFPRRRSTISIVFENISVLCLRRPLIPVCSTLFSARWFRLRPHRFLNLNTNRSVWNGCKRVLKLSFHQRVVHRNNHLQRKFDCTMCGNTRLTPAFLHPPPVQWRNHGPPTVLRAMAMRSLELVVPLRRRRIRFLRLHRPPPRKILGTPTTTSLCLQLWMWINLWWRRAQTFHLLPYSISISVVRMTMTMMTLHRQSSQNEMPHRQHWIDWRISMTLFEAMKHPGREQHSTSWRTTAIRISLLNTTMKVSARVKWVVSTTSQWRKDHLHTPLLLTIWKICETKDVQRIPPHVFSFFRNLFISMMCPSG